MPLRRYESGCIEQQVKVVASPRNHQGRTAASRKGGGRVFMGESQDLGQCAHDGDLAATARPDSFRSRSGSFAGLAASADPTSKLRVKMTPLASRHVAARRRR
jgi:hypothetical protein